MNRSASLAYLVSQYPAVRHTFILREVLELRRLGLPLQTASVMLPQQSADGSTEAERREAERTFYVKGRGLQRILLDHADCLLRRPGRYMAALSLALRLAGPDLRDVAYHLFYFAEAVVLGRWLRRNALTHVHVHFGNSAVTAALLVRKIYGIPYSITIHGSDEFYDVKFYRLREKIEGAAFVRCVSNFTRSQIMKETAPEHWSKLEVCPLGVNLLAFAGRAESSPGPFTIACTGGLVFGKGQVTLMTAVATLRSRGRSVRLDLVGDGPDRKAMEREAARLDVAAEVTFHGSVNQDRVREILSTAAVFVLPSFAEGVPVSLMEAMAMEIPCISTYVGGIPELIRSGEDGLLIAPSDPEALTAALEELMDNPDLRSRLGKAGRRKIADKYNLTNNVERLVSIFQRRLGLGAGAKAEHAL